MIKKIFLLFLIFGAAFSYGDEAKESATASPWQDFTSFYKEDLSFKVMMTGGAIAALLAATKKNTSDKVRDSMQRHKPLGEYSKYGDYAGQLVPNILYLGGMYLHGYLKDDETSKERGTLMVKTTLYSGVLVNVLKYTVREERPNKSNKVSFPSGHTATAFAFASVVGLEHGPLATAGAYLLATFVGASRINDNMHYLHDVVFGASIGFAYGYSLHAELERQRRRRENTFSYFILPEDGGLSLRVGKTF